MGIPPFFRGCLEAPTRPAPTFLGELHEMLLQVRDAVPLQVAVELEPGDRPFFGRPGSGEQPTAADHLLQEPPACWRDTGEGREERPGPLASPPGAAGSVERLTARGPEHVVAGVCRPQGRRSWGASPASGWARRWLERPKFQSPWKGVRLSPFSHRQRKTLCTLRKSPANIGGHRFPPTFP